jgi:hypothetical protein
MKNDPTLVRRACQFVGGAWMEASASHIAIYKYDDDSERENFAYIPTRTGLEKQRAVNALRRIAEFVEDNQT